MNNEERAQWGRTALAPFLADNGDDLASACIDLIADVLHCLAKDYPDQRKDMESWASIGLDHFDNERGRICDWCGEAFDDAGGDFYCASCVIKAAAEAKLGDIPVRRPR